MMPPMVAVVAEFEPEMAANRPQELIVANPRPPRSPADAGMREIGKPPSDACRGNQVTSQDEQRQRQQAEEVQSFKQGDTDIGQREIDDQRCADHPVTYDQENRHADQKQHDDAGRQQPE
jgi:hypothetical protein